MLDKIKEKLSKLKPEKQLSYTIFKPRYKLFIKHLIIWILLFIFFISILTWFFEKPTTIIELWNELVRSFDQIIQVFSLYMSLGMFFALPIAGIILYFHEYISNLNSLDYDQKIIKNLIPSCVVTLPFYLGIFTLFFSVFGGEYEVPISIILGWIALLFVRHSHYFYPDLEKKIGEGIGYIIAPFGIVLLIIPLGQILENPTPFLEQFPLIITFFGFFIVVTIAIEMFMLYLATENLKNVKIKKITNYKVLIERFNSAANNEQKEDIKAEIDVGLHHVKKGHKVEYEPQRGSPDFKIDANSIFFYTEIKRVNEPEDFVRRKNLIKDFKKRFKFKIKSPYNINLHLDYSHQMALNIRRIAEYIINNVNRINLREDEQGRSIDIEIDGSNYGSMIVYKPRKKTKKQKILFGQPVWTDMAHRIREQIIRANQKTLPQNQPYFVVVKIPDFVDRQTAKEALFGSEEIRLYWKNGQIHPTYYIEKHIVNKIFNNPNHYKKISAIIYFYKEFKEQNAIYEINKNADFKLTRHDIKELYFDCKLLQ